MDEVERKNKLQAGKDALLAFQKKKKKKKPKTSDVIATADDGAFSDNSLIVDSIHEGQALNETDDTEQVPPADSVCESNSTHNHTFSHTQNGTDDHTEQLTQQIAHYKEKVRELEQQLQKANETRETAVKDTRHQLVAEYQRQMSSLHESLQNTRQELVDARASHKSEIQLLLEQQEAIKESLNKKHAEHIVRLTAQLSTELNEGKVPEDETEREAERMKQLKETLVRVHEQEKETMSLSHQREKELLKKENEKEKQLLVSQYQAAMEANKRQLETLANEQIKQLHAQYVAVHAALEQQRNELEKEVQESGNKIISLERTKQEMTEEMRRLHESHHHEIQEMKHESQDLKSRLHDWKNKASSLEARIHQSGVDQNNAREIEEQVRSEYRAQLGSKQVAINKLQEEVREKEGSLTVLRHDYDVSLKAFQDKVADREATIANQHQLLQQKECVVKELEQERRHDVEREEHNQTLRNRIEQLESEREAAVESLRMQYEHQLQREKTNATELKDSMHKMVDDHKNALKEMQSSHDATMKELKSKHLSEVSLLEDSINEQTGSCASLEFAEAHMKELQLQLNAYRNQEVTHKETIETLEREHASAMEHLKVSMATREEERVAQLTEEHAAKCLGSEREIDSLRRNIDQHQLVVEELNAKHKSEIEAAVSQCNADHARAIEELEARHLKDAADAEHTRDATFATRLALELDRLRQELSLEKEVALKCARDDNKMAIEQLKQSLKVTGEEALSEARSRVIDLEDKLREMDHITREGRQAQEKCQIYETELKAIQVKLSLSQSEMDNKTTCVEQLEKDVTKWKETAGKAQTSLSLALEELNSATEQHETKLAGRDHHYQQRLQAKDDEIATHQSHNKVLNTRVTELTQELKHEREAVAAIKKKVEDDATKVLDSQLTEVQSQLDEAKEKYSNLLSEWKEKEEGLQEKVVLTEQLLSQTDLQWNTKMEQINKELSQAKNQCQMQEARIVTMATDNDGLNASLAALQSQHQQLLQDKSRLELTLRQEIEQLQRALDESNGTLEVVRNDCQRLSVEKNELQLHLKEFQEDNVAGLHATVDQQAMKIAALQSQLTSQEKTTNTLRDSFTKQLADAEAKQAALKKQIQVSHRFEGKLSSLTRERGDIEKALSRSRQSLIEKLREKDLLEKDLGFHRTELERRLAEKQRLEELLFEKSKFEQELTNQKDHLKMELESIEKKLKTREQDYESDKGDLSNSFEAEIGNTSI